MKLWSGNNMVLQGNTPLEYCQVYWNEYIDDLLDSRNSEVVMESPHMLIGEIISEITYHQFKNSDNVSYYKTKLGEWLKRDKIFNKLFKQDIILSFDYFDAQHSLMLKEIYKGVLGKFNTERYFEKLFTDFVDFMESNPPLSYENKQRINEYVNLIIAEFKSEGFAIEDIKSLPSRIDDVAITTDGNVIAAADSFFELKETDYETKEKYHEAIAKRIESRTVSECLQGIINKFYCTPQEGYMLVRLMGLKGNIDTTIDDVHIYSPRSHKYITGTGVSDIEAISDKDYLNAAIPIESVGLHSSINYAKHKLSSVLEILSIVYNTKVKIDYGRGNFVIAINGNENGFYDTVDSDDERYQDRASFYRYAMSFDAKEIEDDKNELTKQYDAAHYPNSETTTKLSNAVHWCYKAKNATTDEDKLLYSWFALEGLMKVSEQVKHSLPIKKDDGVIKVVQYIAKAILSIQKFHDYWCEVYTKTLYSIQDEFLSFHLSEDLKKRAGLNLNYGDKYDTKSFFACILELEEAISHQLFKNELHEVSEYYSSKKGFEDYARQIENDILVIYRLRNLIAHNAVIPSESLMLYSRKAYAICRYIIRYFIGSRTNRDVSIEKMIIDASIRYLRFSSSIEEKICELKGIK